jgi:hypothetical protein
MIDLSVPLQGMQRAEQSMQATAARLASIPLGADGAAVDSVDLSAAAVAMIQARNLMEVNVKAMQAAQDMVKHSLDILG